MKKKIKVGTANARMSNIKKTFGVDSEVYKMASDYIEERVDEKFIKRDTSGNITGIRQTKEAEKLSENAFGRSDVFDEFLPTVSGLLKAVKEENDIKGSVKDNRTVLINLAEVHAANLRSYDVTVDDIYDVRDDVDALGDATMVAEAQQLLDEREKTSAWLSAARDLVARYDEAVQEARQNRN